MLLTCLRQQVRRFNLCPKLILLNNLIKLGTKNSIARSYLNRSQKFLTKAIQQARKN